MHWVDSSSPGNGAEKRRARSLRRPPSVSAAASHKNNHNYAIIMSQFHCTALERKISVRANRDELVQKGILLPESPLGNIPEPGK